MRQVHIGTDAIIEALWDSGYFCERVPDGETWYETDCPVEHGKLSILPTGLGIVLAGTVLQTQAQWEQDYTDQRSACTWSEKRFLPLFPPYHSFVVLPQRMRVAEYEEMLLPYPDMK